MATAAELLVRINGDSSGALRALADVEKATGKLGGTGGAAGKALSGALSLPGKLVSGLGSIGLAGLGIQSLIGTVESLGDALGLNLAADTEDAMAQLLAFTKDAGVAAGILDSLQGEADVTPFGFADMSRAATMLLPMVKSIGLNLMDVIKQGEILAALNPAEGLVGAAFSIREALSGDFVSIVERFNLPRDAINKLKKEGVPAMEVIRRVLADMGADMSLVTNLAGNFRGRVSTFGDALAGIRREAGKPILEALKGELERFTGLLGQNASSLQLSAQNIGTAIGRLVTGAGQELATWITTVGNIARTHGLNPLDASIVAIEDRIKEVFGEGAAGTFHAFIDGIKGLPGTIGRLVDAIGDLASGAAPVFAKLGEMKDDFLAGIREMIATIRRDFYGFIISLSNVPVFGKQFEAEADRMRKELGWDKPVIPPGAITAVTGGRGVAVTRTPAAAEMPVFNVNFYGDTSLHPEQIRQIVSEATGQFATVLDASLDTSANAAPASLPGT